MALIEADVITNPDQATPKLSNEEWWTGVERLRELGFDIPEYDPDDGAEHVATLPDVEPSPRRG